MTLVWLFVISLFNLSLCSKDSFKEELLIKPLLNNKVYAYFQFTTVWDVDPEFDSLLHTNLFPRAISEILTRYEVQELHLSLTTGLWRYDTWGYPAQDAPPGAEMWAWFTDGTEDIDEKWNGLSNSLSGLICASLNFMDQTTSVRPFRSLKPRGVILSHYTNKHVRYAALPREIVCTENLTPWKKLLPCDSKLGLASLLNSGYIHNTRYHSVGLHVRPICKDKECLKIALELKQTVSLVYDSLLLGSRDWSIRKLFGQGILSKCPLAESSNVYVDTTINKTVPFVLTPTPDELITSTKSGISSTFAQYNINGPLMIQAAHTGKREVVLNIPPPIHASQYKIGYGQQKGGIVNKIYNNHWDGVNVILMQYVPWYVPIYLHTLKVVTGGREIIVNKEQITFLPGNLREKPYSLEIKLSLPARSITTVSIDFDFVFLKWQEYPPDANHGFYIGSSIITAHLPLPKNYSGISQKGSTIYDSFNAVNEYYLIQIRTESLVITLPTPDFSMPYNVICLACTVVALAFGPLHNITTKRLLLKVESNAPIIIKLLQKIGLVRKTPTSTDATKKED